MDELFNSYSMSCEGVEGGGYNSAGGEGGDSEDENNSIEPNTGDTKYAGKFNSVEELEQAYAEAEKGMTIQGQGRATAEDALAELYGDRQGEEYEEGVDEDGYPLEEYEEEEYEGDSTDEVRAAVREEMLPMRIQNEINAVRANHPEDFDEKLPAIVEILESRPDFGSVKNPLELAYDLASARSAKQAGIEEAYKNKGKKEENGQLLGGGARQGDDDGEITAKDVGKMSVEEYTKNRAKILRLQREGKIK